MPENSTEKAKPSRGRPFTKGDPRRHQHSATCGHKLHEFTTEERSRGFFTAMAVMGLSIGVKLHQQGRWPGYRGR